MSNQKTMVDGLVRTYFRAVSTGDIELLTTVCLPHPELGRLLPSQPRPGVAAMLADLPRLPVESRALAGERHIVQADVGGMLHVMIVRSTATGPRIDARYAIAALKADDDRRRVAREYYRAMLLGHRETLVRLSFDARGIELLADTPPAGEGAQIEAMAQGMALVELGAAEPFVVRNGVEFVSARHAEMGITVLSGLLASGETPFLLRQREDGWKVLPFHFLQAAALRRGAKGRMVISAAHEPGLREPRAGCKPA